VRNMRTKHLFQMYIYTYPLWEVCMRTGHLFKMYIYTSLLWKVLEQSIYFRCTYIHLCCEKYENRASISDVHIYNPV
jgi:hypothetical protein